VRWDSHQDASLEAAVNEGRIPGIFVGPPDFLIRLYEGPPDADGILFENGMRFHGMDVIEDGRIVTGPLVRHEGESLRFRLWWSVDQPVDLDYSVGTHLRATGTKELLTQLDNAPFVIDGPRETSRWEPGRYYIEEREMRLPYPIDVGDFILYLIVYEWQSNTQYAAPGTDTDIMLPLQTLKIMAW
jgi:hypothetical protein